MYLVQNLISAYVLIFVSRQSPHLQTSQNQDYVRGHEILGDAEVRGDAPAPAAAGLVGGPGKARRRGARAARERARRGALPIFIVVRRKVLCWAVDEV